MYSYLNYLPTKSLGECKTYTDVSYKENLVCEKCMKKNDLMEEGFLVWKEQTYWGSKNCKVDD